MTVTVVVAGPDLDVYTIESFRVAVEAGQDDDGAVVADLTATTFVDVTALGVLNTAHKRGPLAVATDQPGVLRPLRTSGLLGVLSVHPDVPAAAASLEELAAVGGSCYGTTHLEG